MVWLSLCLFTVIIIKMLILFRPGLENNLVANAVIKLNVTVAELLLV